VKPLSSASSTVGAYSSTVERFHGDVDLSVGVVENAESEAGDGHEQAGGALDDDVAATQGELRRGGVGDESTVDDHVELTVDTDAQRRRRVVTDVDHHRLHARHGRVRQALGRLVGDLEVAVRHHLGALDRPAVQLHVNTPRTQSGDHSQREYSLALYEQWRIQADRTSSLPFICGAWRPKMREI